MRTTLLVALVLGILIGLGFLFALQRDAGGIDLAATKKANFQQVKNAWERSRELAKSRSASREEYDRDYFAMLKAQAEWDEAAAEHALVEAPARADDIAIEEGNVAAAEARLRLAEAEL